MSPAERERFLAGVHVGVLSLNQVKLGPLAAPVWYGYQQGGKLYFVTGRDSRKGRLLHEGTRISLCVQNESAPYQYVSVEGPVTRIVDADLENDVRPLARRYLGTEGGDRYMHSLDPDEEDAVLVRMSIERWFSADYRGDED